MKKIILVLAVLLCLFICGPLYAQLNFENFQKISSTHGNLGITLGNNEAFGYRMANIGDLDGDGVPDIAVGAPGNDGTGTAQGALYILFMKNDGTVKSTQIINSSSGNLGVTLVDNERFGHSVALIGDLDGDGVQDLAVGAIGHNNFVGGVYILFMQKDGTVKSHTLIDGNTSNFSYPTAYQFSHDVASPGDIDGDGIPDLAVGAISDNDGGAPYGAVYIIFMKKDGSVKGFQQISETKGSLGINLTAGGYFGYSLAKIGDADGNGTPDLVVGVPGFAVSGSQIGVVFILYLNSDGTVKSYKEINNSSKNFSNAIKVNEAFGTSVQMIDDANRDGIKELLVGSEHYNYSTNDKGTVYVLYLDSSRGIKSYDRIGPSTISALNSAVGSTNLYGISVIALPNFNSSYTHTIAVGAIADSDGNPKAGAIYVLFLKGHTTGINENTQITSNTYHIYPNPVSGILNIDLSQNNDNKAIEIVDVTGQIMAMEQTYGAKYAIDLSNYPKGIYFVRIMDLNMVYTEKVVKL